METESHRKHLAEQLASRLLVNVDSRKVVTSVVQRTVQLQRSNHSAAVAFALASMHAGLVVDYKALARFEPSMSAEQIRTAVAQVARQQQGEIVGERTSITQLCLVFGSSPAVQHFSRKIMRLIMENQTSTSPDVSLLTLVAFYLACRNLGERCDKAKLLSQSLVNGKAFENAVIHYGTRAGYLTGLLAELKDNGKSLRKQQQFETVEQAHGEEHAAEDDKESEDDDDEQEKNESRKLFDGINSMISRLPWHKTKRYEDYLKWKEDFTNMLAAEFSIDLEADKTKVQQEIERHPSRPISSFVSAKKRL